MQPTIVRIIIGKRNIPISSSSTAATTITTTTKESKFTLQFIGIVFLLLQQQQQLYHHDDKNNNNNNNICYYPSVVVSTAFYIVPVITIPTITTSRNRRRIKQYPKVKETTFRRNIQMKQQIDEQQEQKQRQQERQQQQKQQSNYNNDINKLYTIAKNIRIRYGHDMAQPLYQQILQKQQQQQQQSYQFPQLSQEEEEQKQQQQITNVWVDGTTSTHLAASISNGTAYQSLINACQLKDNNNNTINNNNNDHLVLLKKVQQLHTFFSNVSYTNTAINEYFFPNGTIINEKKNSNSSNDTTTTTTIHNCPLYITPASAGSYYIPYQNTITRNNNNNSTTMMTIDDDNDYGTNNSILPQTVIECLLHLFLIGIVVPIHICNKFLSKPIVTLLLQLNLLTYCTIDPTLVFGVVSIIPIQYNNNNNNNNYSTSSTNQHDQKQQQQQQQEEKTAWIVTDWHPIVLNTISIENSGDSVMYIGPDSLALYQHWIANDSNNNYNNNNISGIQSSNKSTTSSSSSTSSYCTSTTSTNDRTVLDLCTGSGIQAILSLLVQRCSYTVCVDTNIRSLRFTYFNMLLNNISTQCFTLVHANLLSSSTISTTKTSTSTTSSSMHNPQVPSIITFDKTHKALSNNNIMSVPNNVTNEQSLYTLLQSIVQKRQYEKKDANTKDTTQHHDESSTSSSRTDESSSNQKIKYYFDEILSNPPFLPVPESSSSLSESNVFTHDGDNVDTATKTMATDTATRTMIEHRYGLFSSGGSSGEDVLQAVLALSYKLLQPNNGVLAIVSEFFFRHPIRDNNTNNNNYNNNNNNGNDYPIASEIGNYIPTHTLLLDRLRHYYNSRHSVFDSTIQTEDKEDNNETSFNTKAILFTNEFPISALTYAKRRSASTSSSPRSDGTSSSTNNSTGGNEEQIWTQHLHNEKIISCSPGLLFLQRTIAAPKTKTTSPENDNSFVVATTTTTTTPTIISNTTTIDTTSSSSSVVSTSYCGVSDDDTVNGYPTEQWTSIIVPKSNQGSIWTPTNRNAIQFTQRVMKEYFIL